MHFFELSDAATFLQRSNALLMTHEAQNNLLLSSALTLARASVARSSKLSFFIIENKGATICAALNSSERRLLLSTADLEAAAQMGRELAARGVRLKGVLGPADSTQVFCRAYADEMSSSDLSRNLRPRLAQKVMKLDARAESKFATKEAPASAAPDSPRFLAPGLSRTAKDKDLKLLLKWSRQFVEECDLEESPQETEEVVRRYLENRQLFIWEDSRPVAMAGYGGQTPNGVRVNMVYTDPTSRGRGYAGSLVHLLSRKLLASGHRSCFLFVDTANLSANRIYENLGYKSVGEFTEYRLEA